MKHILLHSLYFSFAVFILLGFNSDQTYAQDDAFTVYGIKVDITADSAKEARDKAFRTAQEKSLPVLFAQLEQGGYDVAYLKTVDTKSIANTIRDFEISNEKISSVRYIGDFVFRYDEALLNPYMNSAYGGVPAQDNDLYNAVRYAPKKSNKDRVLVLPFFQSGGGETSLWSGYNPWKDVWVRASTSSIMAPIGDLEDIRDIQDPDALTYNPENLANMAVRYSADRVIVLLASHERSALPASLSHRANGVFRVNIYDTAKGRPEFVNDIVLEEGTYKNFGEVLQAGYNRSVEFIHGLGSVRNIGRSEAAVLSTDTTPSQQYSFDPSQINQTSLQARIEYTSMQEWVMAQKALKAVSGVSKLDVLSLTPRHAEIKLSFHGGLDNMATAMAQKGYNLQQTDKPGRFLIYSGRGGQYNQQGGVVYR